MNPLFIKKICEKSILLSELNTGLKLYGYSGGIEANIQQTDEQNNLLVSKKVHEWISGGGVTEDEGKGGQDDFFTTRAFNHFHDPLRVWDEAYFHSALSALTTTGPGRGRTELTG